MTDNHLIEELKRLYGVKELTKLAEAIEIPYPTLSRWEQQGKIKERGSAKLYLKALIREKMLELRIKELEAEVAIIDDFAKLLQKRK